MIVKNEEQKLPRCLDSVKGYVDEIVIVDTGSTDRTLEIAKAHNARTYEIQWPGAFDAARNESIKHVETEWILWLDADEWLAEGSGAKIRRATEREDAYCFGVIMREVGEELVETSMTRLFRSRPHVPFVGIVHEHLDQSVLAASGETRKEFSTDILILHDGYSPEQRKAKADRTIDLLKKELAIRPGQPYYEAKLACTLAAAGHPDARQELLRIGDRLLEMEDEMEVDIAYASVFGPLFAILPDEELRSAGVDTLIRLAGGWFPENPVVLWHVAQIEVRRNNLPSALYALLDIEKMAETGQFDRRTPYHPGILSVGLWTNLALVAHQMGRRDVALRNYRRLLEADPNNEMAKQNMAKLQA